MFLIEVYAAGPQAITRRLELQSGLARALAELAGGSEEDRFAVEALLAAIVGLVTARLGLATSTACATSIHRWWRWPVGSV